MEKVKKLKDLKKGDRLYDYDIADTTPITVVSAKRTGAMVEAIVKWDDTEYTCFGHALNTILTGKSKGYLRDDRIFTTSYKDAHNREMCNRRRYNLARIGSCVADLCSLIKKEIV